MKISQTIIIVVLTCLLVGAITWAMHERYSKVVEQSVNSEGAKQLAKPALEKVKEFKDSLKQNHAVFANKEEVDGKLVAVSQTVLDTIANMSGIDKKRIVNWQQINVETEGKLMKAERKIDSLNKVVFFFKDKYLELAYRPANAGDSTSNGTFDYKYTADLNVTDYSKGGRFLGVQVFQPKYYTDIFSTDPRMTIKGYKKLTIEQKQNPFGLKLDVLGKYDLGTGGTRFGAGARFDFGRAMLTFDGYYVPGTNTFTQEAGARFSILK